MKNFAIFITFLFLFFLICNSVFATNNQTNETLNLSDNSTVYESPINIPPAHITNSVPNLHAISKANLLIFVPKILQ